MFRALRPESAKDIEPFIGVERVIGNGRGQNGNTLYLAGLSSYSYSGFNDKYHFMSRVAIKGTERRLPYGVEGFVTPHQSNQYVKVERLSHIKHEDQEFFHYYDFEEPQVDLTAKLLVPGVARALFDTANGESSPYPQELAKYQEDLYQRMADMLDDAIDRLPRQI